MRFIGAGTGMRWWSEREGNSDRNGRGSGRRLQAREGIGNALGGRILYGRAMTQKTYIAIDLKSFFASVECRERELDPLNTHLVVADESRTDKTICLAVTPALKSFGIPGRARLFEVKQKVQQVNAARQDQLRGRAFSGSTHFFSEWQKNPSLSLDFLIAPPRMATYMAYSTRIYGIYMKYVAPEDVIVYSIDEVFIDATSYLKTYDLSPHDLAMKMILDVLNQTGITATAGIGTNLYLCKVAMDVRAKHIPADRNGVRIAELDEMSYRREFWSHRPITDFWRVGRGYAKRLSSLGLYTMGDVARCSIENEELLYRLFGKNAELLIDHAWGWEPCTIEAVKAYRPETNSLSSGQVLQHPYEAAQAKLVLREMADTLSLELVEKGLATDQIAIHVGYDIENLSDPERNRKYHGERVVDHYGRSVPKPAQGSENLSGFTASTQKILQAVEKLFDRIVDPGLLVRRMNVIATHVVEEGRAAQKEEEYEQLDFFSLQKEKTGSREEEIESRRKERRLQEAEIAIRNKYGKNAILKGMNFLEGATARERNKQIGGHKA